MIKMEDSQENKLLRKIRKMIFRDSNQGIQTYRSFLNDLLQVEHPNMPQLKDFREDYCNFYLVFEGCCDENLFEQINFLVSEGKLTMNEKLAAEITR